MVKPGTNICTAAGSATERNGTPSLGNAASSLAYFSRKYVETDLLSASVNTRS